MWYHRVMRAPDGAPAGGSTGTPAASGEQTGGAGSGNGGESMTPPAFDWKTAGVDAEGLAVVQDRQWKGVNDVVTSYRNLEKLTGVPPERIIKLPGEKDGPEAWDSVYKRLGRPDKAEEYKIPLPEGDKGEFAKTMAPIFHKAGLSQAMVQKLAEETNAYVANRIKAEQTARDAAHQEEINLLKQEWGPKYDEFAELADKAGAAFGVTKEHVLALKQVLGPKAAMQFFHNIGSKIAVEGQFVSGDKGETGGGGIPKMTPTDAQSQIKVLTKSREFAQQFNAQDPKVRQEAREKMRLLQQMAYPGTDKK